MAGNKLLFRNYSSTHYRNRAQEQYNRGNTLRKSESGGWKRGEIKFWGFLVCAFSITHMRSAIKRRVARWSFICVHQFNEKSRLANLSKLPWSVRTPSNKTTSGCLRPTLSAVCSLHHFTINYRSITTSWLHCIHVEQYVKHNPLTKRFPLYVPVLRQTNLVG